MSIRRAQDERIEGTPDGLGAISEIMDFPDAPTAVTAANVGTGRAYNNGAASVTVTPAVTGGTPASYNVISTPGSFTGTGASPVTVSGLQSQTSYTFRATGVTSSGVIGIQSGNSNSITATTVPQAPTIGTATAGDGNASVTFTANATGGSTITGYTVTSSSGASNTGASSPIVVTETVAGTRTYTVTATNANGTSAASAASNSLVFAAPGAPTIGTVTRTSDTVVSIPFTAGTTGNASITSYTTVSSPSISLSTTGTTTPLSATGTFATGTAYTFTIAATNKFGTGTASSASNSVTPKQSGIIGTWTFGSTIPDNGNANSRYFGSGVTYNSGNTNVFTVGGGSTENKTNYMSTPPSGSWATGTNINIVWTVGGQAISNYSDTFFAHYGSTLRTIVTSATAWVSRTNSPASLIHAAGAGDDTGLYLTGRYVSSTLFNTHYRYTFASNWTTLTVYPINVSHAQSAAGNGVVVVAGGSNTGSSSSNIATAYSYSQSGTTWTSIAALPVNKSQGAGFFVGTTSAGTVNRYYVGGGMPPQTNGGSADIYSYSASTGTWRTESNAVSANRSANMFYDKLNYRMYQNGGDTGYAVSPLSNYYASIV
jgi:trimeric autotransporter adhesin